MTIRDFLRNKAVLTEIADVLQTFRVGPGKPRTVGLLSLVDSQPENIV